MKKEEFLNRLRIKLDGLPKQEIDERVEFYSEMIADRIEEGLSEEEAVAKIGSAEELAWGIISETPSISISEIKTKFKKKIGASEITLLAVGSPIWGALLIVIGAVLFSAYVAVWAMVIAVWAIGAAFVGCAIGGVFLFGLYLYVGNIPLSIFAFGVACVLAGLAIFGFKLCKIVTKSVAVFGEKAVSAWKNCLKRRVR